MQKRWSREGNVFVSCGIGKWALKAVWDAKIIVECKNKWRLKTIKGGMKELECKTMRGMKGLRD